jgi:acetyltransferase
MLDAARVLGSQPIPSGARAAIITNSGGTGTELADLLADEGITLPELSQTLRAQLAELLPRYASTANPVDITPIWTQFAELYPAVLELLARSGEVDIVIPVLLHRSAENVDVAHSLIEKVDELRRADVQTSVYVCWVARRSAWSIAAGLNEAGIPCLEWPARTAKAVGHAVRYARYRRAIEASELPPRPQPATLPFGVGTDPVRTRDFVVSNGIPVVETVVCETYDAALAQAEKVGFPVVAKAHHQDLLHKSDTGGVRVGLANAEDLRAAVTHLLGLVPDAKVLIQKHVHGVELVIGGLRDETLGPVVAFGLGGVLVEVLDDVSFSTAHMDQRMAETLLNQPRGSSILDGVRGSAPVDRSELGRLLASVGRMMSTYPEIMELDLNPIICGMEGAVAVDVRLIRKDVDQQSSAQ